VLFTLGCALQTETSYLLPRELLSDGIANRIKSLIITGELRPGDHLVETDLAFKLGVSRAPLREALRQLTSEGVLVSQPHRGTFVRELTEQDILEIYSLRGALEALAVEILVERITPEQVAILYSVIDEMKESLQNKNKLPISNLDMKLHETICRLTGHSRLYEAWSRMGTQLKSFFLAADPLYNDEQMINRHVELVEVIASGDKVKAVEVIKEHISNAGVRLLARTQKEPLSEV